MSTGQRSEACSSRLRQKKGLNLFQQGFGSPRAVSQTEQEIGPNEKTFVTFPCAWAEARARNNVKMLSKQRANVSVSTPTGN